MSGLRTCQKVRGVGVGGQDLVVEVGQGLEDLLVVEDPLDALEGRLPLAVAEVRVRGVARDRSGESLDVASLDQFARHAVHYRVPNAGRPVADHGGARRRRRGRPAGDGRMVARPLVLARRRGPSCSNVRAAAVQAHRRAQRHRRHSPGRQSLGAEKRTRRRSPRGTLGVARDKATVPVERPSRLPRLARGRPEDLPVPGDEMARPGLDRGPHGSADRPGSKKLEDRGEIVIHSKENWENADKQEREGCGPYAQAQTAPTANRYVASVAMIERSCRLERTKAGMTTAVASAKVPTTSGAPAYARTRR